MDPDTGRLGSGKEATYLGFGTKDRGPRTKDLGQRTKDLGQRTKDLGQRTKDLGQTTKDRGTSVIVGVNSHLAPDEYISMLLMR
jgi:hypothetical protein